MIERLWFYYEEMWVPCQVHLYCITRLIVRWFDFAAWLMGQNKNTEDLQFAGLAQKGDCGEVHPFIALH